MKKKLVLSAMLVALLALGLSLVGCPTEDDDDGGGGGGGIVPTELQGNWLRDTAGTERHLRITSNGWGKQSDNFPNDDEIYFIITSSTGTKIDYHHKFSNDMESFNWVVSGTTLTITGSTYDHILDNGTYTKQ
jgi:hypothetical protein